MKITSCFIAINIVFLSQVSQAFEPCNDEPIYDAEGQIIHKYYSLTLDTGIYSSFPENTVARSRILLGQSTACDRGAVHFGLIKDFYHNAWGYNIGYGVYDFIGVTLNYEKYTSANNAQNLFLEIYGFAILRVQFGLHWDLNKKLLPFFGVGLSLPFPSYDFKRKRQD